MSGLAGPQNRQGAGSACWANWLIAAAVLFVVAGGYWVFSQTDQKKIEHAQGPVQAERQSDRGPQPGPEKLATPAAQNPAGAETGSYEASAATGAAQRTLAAGAAIEGLYAGPTCYGPGTADPPRCFRAQAVVARGKIAGQWPGRDPGVTMVLAGEVSASGEANIHIDAEKPDGIRTAAIDLTGTLKAGRLDASGTFRDGRTAVLNWRKSASESP